jgi:hypothetical protein
MPIKLYDLRMHDGSRQFIDFPETVFFDELREHTGEMEGAKITGFITDWVTEVWLDFAFRGQKISINNQFGEYWFFVDDPECSKEIMLVVAAHFQKLLENERE